MKLTSLFPKKIFLSIELITNDSNHFVYGLEHNYFENIGLEIYHYLEEIKNYIEADEMKKIKYRGFIYYYTKWYKFVTTDSLFVH